MKAIEEGTDRSAELHFYVEGSVDPLREYGEYIAADNAVCCYVPVEEGYKPRISGIFTGTVSTHNGGFRTLSQMTYNIPWFLITE